MSTRTPFQIDGRVVERPGNHPNPELWRELRKQVGERQRWQCATCWISASDGVQFDLHHRHYDTFGNESADDLVLLCRDCHEAITVRFKAARYARGDSIGGLVRMIARKPRVRRPAPQPQPQDEPMALDIIESIRAEESGKNNRLLHSLCDIEGQTEGDLRRRFYQALGDEKKPDTKKRAFYRAKDWMLRQSLIDLDGQRIIRGSRWKPYE